MKGCILLFFKKSDLGITKKNRGITFIAISAKVYNALLLHHIKLEIEKILRKNQNNFQKNQSTTSQILIIYEIIEGVCTKKTQGSTIVHRFLLGIWFHTQKEDGANTTSIWSLQRNLHLWFCFICIYQPLHIGRIWYKVIF